MSLIVAHPQSLSPLVTLPPEIKHIITRYALQASSAILDPLPGTSNATPREPPAKLGINVLQTCRRMNLETDIRPIFTQNHFRFTSVDRMRSFFRAVGKELSSCVRDVEVDARNLHSKHPSVAREWSEYLRWGSGPWADTLGSLKEDAPGLKCLRLNFEAWPTIPMYRAELWTLLRNLLVHVRGLERIIVVGASKGVGMAKKEPWSPVHFVGGDDVGADDLVERMWAVVRDDEEKIVRWTRESGKLVLEVVSKNYLLENVDPQWTGPCMRKHRTDAWPVDGSCTWFAYLNRDSDVTEPTTKGLNPSAAE